MPTLQPVDHDPFDGAGPMLMPVSHDPFAVSNAARLLQSGDRLPSTSGAEPLQRAVDAMISDTLQPGRDLGGTLQRASQVLPTAPMDYLGPAAAAVVNVMPGPKGMGAAYRGIEAATPALSRVSTRLPTAVKSVENVLGPERLQIGTDAMRVEPKVWSNVDLVNDYPGFKSSNHADRDVTAREFIDHVKSNLLYLHDNIAPEIRDRSSRALPD